MIIGINGKIGAGKDTVGTIIQGLLLTNKNQSSEIKKFAGKLKQIASILTGIPVKKFEDQEFKKNYLDSEWGTVQDIPLNSIPPFADIKFNTLMTVREFLQKLGTEAMRDGLHVDTWVNALFADYHPTPNKSMEESFKEQFVTGSSEIHYKLPNWIITDMRFPNEMEAVKERNGITIRVTRNPIIVITLDGEKLTLDYNEWLKQKQFYENQGWQFTEHPSETALDNADFDYEIVNDGTIEDLVEKVKEILTKENII